MQVLSWLKQVGGRFGIVRVVVEAPSPANGSASICKVTTQSLTLDQLTQVIQTVRPPGALSPDSPGEMTLPFDDVFRAAGVKAAASLWTVERLERVLAEPGYAGLDRRAVQAELVRRMAAEQAKVEDVVKDAIARDHALDAFAEFVQQRVRQRQSERQRQRAELENRMKDLRAEVARLEEEAKAEDAQWQEWKQRKLACEKAMAKAVGYLVDEQVVTVDE